MIKVENDELRIKGGVLEVFEEYGCLAEAMVEFFSASMSEENAKKLVTTVVYVATSDDMEDDKLHTLAVKTGDIIAEALRKNDQDAEEDKDVLGEIKEMLIDDMLKE